MKKFLTVTLGLILTSLSFAQAGCDFTYDEVQANETPDTNYKVVVKRDDEGNPVFWAQLMPLNPESRAMMKKALDEKKPICVEGTRFNRVVYVYNASIANAAQSTEL